MQVAPGVVGHGAVIVEPEFVATVNNVPSPFADPVRKVAVVCPHGETNCPGVNPQELAQVIVITDPLLTATFVTVAIFGEIEIVPQTCTVVPGLTFPTVNVLAAFAALLKNVYGSASAQSAPVPAPIDVAAM